MARRNSILKVSLRNVAAHKLRLALTLMAVVLGTSFIAGSFMFTNSLSKTFDQAISNSFTGVDAAVSPVEGEVNLSADTRQAIAEDELVSGVNVQSEESIVLANSQAEAFQFGGGTASLKPFYPESEQVGQKVDIVEGQAPRGAGEVAITQKDAEKLGISLGDDLLVVTPMERISVKVTGFTKLEIEQPQTVAVHMAADSFMEKFHGDGEVEQLAVAGTVEPQALVDHLNNKYDVDAATGDKLAEEISQRFSEGMKFINYFLIAFGLIALLVGTFIIANTFSMIVAQRIKEFALLRALGASRRQISNSVVVEALIIGLIGSAVGVVAGIGLVAAIKAVMASQGMDLGGGLGLGVSAVAVPLALGTIVTVVSAWAPAKRAGDVEPVEAMRSTETATGSSLKVRTAIGAAMLLTGALLALWGAMAEYAVGTRASLVGLGAFAVIIGVFLAGPALSLPVVPTMGAAIGKPFGAMGRLAATNSRRNPRRTSATAFALLLGIALVTAIGMLGATTRASVSATIEENIVSDYVLSGPIDGRFPTPNETARVAAETEGVGNVVTAAMAPVTVDGASSLSYGPHLTQTMTLDKDPTSMVKLDMVEGEADFVEAGGFIATQDFAEQNGWKVGQSYELAAPGLSQETIDVQLVGIFETNNVIENMAVNEELVRQLLPADALEVTMVGVDAQPGYDLEQLRTNLENAVKDLVVVQVLTGEDISGQAAQMINQMLAILYGLLALAVIIAILGILNTLTLGVIERRQEIGMLRAVGTQRRQIRQMITLEAVQVSIFGAVLGMLLGLGLGWAFIEVLADAGLDSASVPWTLLLVVLLGSALVGLVAAIWPAQRAAKTPPLEAIAD